MSEVPAEHLWTRQEVATRYRVHVNTVDRWIASGELQCRYYGRLVRVTDQQLADFDFEYPSRRRDGGTP